MSGGDGTIIRGRVFGEWDAPMTDDDIPCDPPVGQPCAWCLEAIRAGDNGRIAPPDGRVEHRECCLRGVLGGIGHLVDHDRYCRATGPDAGLSHRRSSLLVWEFHQATRGTPTTGQLADWRARVEELTDA